MNGIKTILLSFFLITIFSYIVFWNTYPDTIAVFNPFDDEIKIRGVSASESWFLFVASCVILLVLIINSFVFSGPESKALKYLFETSKISFTLHLLMSDYYAIFATVFPTLTLFILIHISFSTANVYGIAVLYLGIICYFQIMQFFQNFKN